MLQGLAGSKNRFFSLYSKYVEKPLRGAGGALSCLTFGISNLISRMTSTVVLTSLGASKIYKLGFQFLEKLGIIHFVAGYPASCFGRVV